MRLSNGRLGCFIDLCDADEPHAANYKRCEIGKQIRIDPAKLVQFRLGQLEPVVEDALLLAAAVEYCDRRQYRPQNGSGRVLVVRVPVHDLGRFQEPDIVHALSIAARTLTGDHWIFEFKQRCVSPILDTQLNMDLPEAERPIVPFSKGMDSWCLSKLLAARNPVLLHLGRPADTRNRKRKENACRTLPFEEIPFQIPHKGLRERSGRGRGFKVAMVSGIAAYLTDSETVVLPESGQGALGPVLAKHRYGDFRSHPEFLGKMEIFLKALLDRTISYEFPRLAFTKGETLREAVNLSNDATWSATRSCWQGARNIPIQRRQCGFCAACLLRRLSVHAAGLEEPRESYACEDLSAPSLEASMMRGFDVSKLEGKSQDYAIAGAIHLDHIADLHRNPVAASSIGRHVRGLARLTGREEANVANELKRLLSQHESEWRSFLRDLGPNSFIRKWCTMQ